MILMKIQIVVVDVLKDVSVQVEESYTREFVLWHLNAKVLYILCTFRTALFLLLSLVLSCDK